MPIPIFPPSREGDLVAWSTNFDQHIMTSALTFGLTAPQASAYNVLHNAFVSAYNIAINPATNSRTNTIIKNNAKEELLGAENGARELVRIIQADPDTTDGMRGTLGLRVRDDIPTPVPVPDVAPSVIITGAIGRTINVRLRDQENPDSRGKPEGVQGATVVYHVGETAPADPTEWVFAMNTSRTIIDVEIPATVDAGSKVWVTAFWFNPRKESGPAGAPQSVRISDGLAAAA